MASSQHWIWRTAVGATCGTAACLLALSGTALAAPSVPAHAARLAVGTNLIVNGTFAEPGPVKHEGATPTDWKLVDLGAEKKPYDASFDAWNAKGKFPPPAGNPNKSDIAAEAFYEAGSATGIEGIGGEQIPAKALEITQSSNAQVSFADAANSAPQASVANWAGSGLEIDFSSGGHAYSLIYLNPWTAYKSTFSGKPADTATVKYILGATLTAPKWGIWKPRSLNADILKQFRIKTFVVQDVRAIDLEDTTSSASPYPNMDGYFADVSITEGKAIKG
jgi:hypothetical protein